MNTDCARCGLPLSRVDRYAIEHHIFDPLGERYREVSVADGGPHGEDFGLSSETDLRCARCGQSLTIDQRRHFYEHWATLEGFK